MEEYVDIVNEITGERTGEIITKKEAHKTGKWHNAIHIWILSEDNTKVLLQKRCPDKSLFPNMWDISVGGHVSSGEDTLEAAKRELSEELGLNPEDYKFELVKIIKEQFIDGDIVSNEFVAIYKIISDIDISNISLQKEEVSDVRWFTKDELNNLTDEKMVIPHVEEFKLINDILS